MLKYHQQFLEAAESYYNTKVKYSIYKSYETSIFYKGYYYVNLGTITITDDLLTEELKNCWLRYRIRFYKTQWRIYGVDFLKGHYTKEQNESRYNHSHVSFDNVLRGFGPICLGNSMANDLTISPNYYKHYKPKFKLKEVFEELFVNIDNILMFEDPSNPYNRIINITRNFYSTSSCSPATVDETLSILKNSMENGDNIVEKISYIDGEIFPTISPKIKNYCPEPYLSKEIKINDQDITMFYLDYLEAIKGLGENGQKPTRFEDLSEVAYTVSLEEYSESEDILIDRDFHGLRYIKVFVDKQYKNLKEEEFIHKKESFEPNSVWLSSFIIRLKQLISYYYATEKKITDRTSEDSSQTTAESHFAISN
jgi:hypothetical protein